MFAGRGRDFVLDGYNPKDGATIFFEAEAHGCNWPQLLH